MKIRISLIIVILAGLTVIGLNVVKVKGKITSLQTRLAEQTTARTKAETDLASTKGDLDRANGVIRQTTAALEAATSENKTLAGKVKFQTEQIRQLGNDLTTLQVRHDDARAKLAAYESVMTVQQVVNAAKQIKELQLHLDVALKEKKIVLANYAKLRAKVNYDEGHPVELPAGIEGRILVADPKWQFVVLNVGEEQGMLEHGELLVSREGKLVSKVIVTRVERDRSVANVMPGWNLAEIKEGDSFIPLRMPMFCGN